MDGKITSHTLARPDTGVPDMCIQRAEQNSTPLQHHVSAQSMPADPDCAPKRATRDAEWHGRTGAAAGALPQPDAGRCPGMAVYALQKLV